MPRNPVPTLFEELPLEEQLAIIIVCLQKFATTESIAKWAIKECEQARDVHDKVIKHFITDPAASGRQSVVELPELERALRVRCRALETLLNIEGLAKRVAAVHEQHTGIVPVALGVIEVAQELRGKAVASYANELKPMVQRVKQAEDRVAAGGHRAFQEEIAAAATKIWIAIDNAWDILGVCLRKAGIYYDPVYASRPTVKTPLRPQLLLVSPEAKAAKAKAPKKNAKKGKVTKRKGSDKGGTATGSDPAAPGTGNGATGVLALTAPGKNAAQG